MSKTSYKIPQLPLIALITLLCVVLFPPVRTLFLEVYNALGQTWRVVIDLAEIGLFALIFAAFLAPLEALGWWAGWYGDEVETVENPGIVERPISDVTAIARYIIYLDGIGQAAFHYLPDVEQFLDRLEASLPENAVLVRGIMPYSVINRPLTQNRPLSFLWRFADYMQESRYGSLAGNLISAIINIRNILIVSVSADQRYGPIYNQGTAQVMYNGLLDYGYKPGSGVPITLIGFSGGGQISMGAMPFLKRALGAPIEVISIAGVIGGNANALKLEHLYHFVGDKDPLERLGPIMFPKRWKIFFLSYWNRAKRKGKITFCSLGPVGHTGPGSAFDDTKFLPDGRSYLRQTLDLVEGIIKGNSPFVQTTLQHKTSNYELYQQGHFNQPSYYPLNQSVDPELYYPIAAWMGRLILPKLEQRHQIKGALFEVHHAPKDYEHLVGEVVNLGWSNDPQVQAYVRSVTKDLHFSDDAEYSQSLGNIHPERLNHWQQVDPLESLAGSRPNDDQIVMLREPVAIAQEKVTKLMIVNEPVQITGRFYGLVHILRPVEDGCDRFQVAHFNRTTRLFDGVEEIICIPQVIANSEGIFPSATKDIENSSPNPEGWYIYGAKDSSGIFVVQAIAPRSLLRLQPDEVVFGESAAVNYVKKHCWEDVAVQKGKTKSVLLCAKKEGIQEAVAEWQEGDRALLLHVYGGIGGKKKESAAAGPIFFGHFAYGAARVVREPLADELSFDIEYYQVYTHNTDAIIAGTLAWNRFIGDRQFGWLGIRPIADILIKLDAFTEDYEFRGRKRSAMNVLIDELEAMEARYRIGDGTGGTYVGPAHNCAQDSNQAAYAAFKKMQVAVDSHSELQDWLAQNPSQAERFHQLMQLGKSIKREMLPFGAARADWVNSENTLGISPEEDAFEGILIGLKSWRTLLPRLASETIAKLFIEQGASVWVLRATQVGGRDPDIEPIAPTQIGW